MRVSAGEGDQSLSAQLNRNLTPAFSFLSSPLLSLSLSLSLSLHLSIYLKTACQQPALRQAKRPQCRTAQDRSLRCQHTYAWDRDLQERFKDKCMKSVIEPKTQADCTTSVTYFEHAPTVDKSWAAGQDGSQCGGAGPHLGTQGLALASIGLSVG